MGKALHPENKLAVICPKCKRVLAKPELKTIDGKVRLFCPYCGNQLDEKNLNKRSKKQS